MKLLKVAIIAKIKSRTIYQRLAPFLRERGHTVDIIDLSAVPTEGFTEHPLIQSLAYYDVVYYRTSFEIDNSSGRSSELEHFLKNSSAKTVNLNFTHHPLAHAKDYEIKTAEKHKLAIPKTIFDSKIDFVELEEKLGLPFVCKTNYGTNGVGVHLIKNEADFIENKEKHADKKLIYQEFIEHEYEYRIHILHGEAVSTLRKAPSNGDFRSNEAQGAEMLPAEPRHANQLKMLSEKAYTAFGFDIFTADFMLDKDTDEFYFTEINLNPGWDKSIMIKLTADYFEDMCKEGVSVFTPKFCSAKMHCS